MTDDKILQQWQAEMDVLARRAGLAIPDDRRHALFEGFKDLKSMLDVLHRPRLETSDLAGLFDPRTITRGLP